VPTFTMTKNWDDGSALTESMLDDIKTSVETFLNTTKLDADNLQDGAITAAKIGTGAVTEAKLGANAVTSAKLASSAGTDGDRAVTSDHIRNNAVTTAKINDNAVTQAKKETRSTGTGAGNLALSTAVTGYSNTGTTYDLVGSINLTTLGGIVHISLVSDGGPAYVAVATNTADNAAAAVIKFMANNTDLAQFEIKTQSDGAGTLRLELPPSAFHHVYIPSAGTYTFKVLTKVTDTSYTCFIDNVRLCVYEV
jgi:hypothetical protein